MKLKNKNIDQLAIMLRATKREEAEIVKNRRLIEDEILFLMKKRGCDKLKTDSGLTIEVEERAKKIVNADLLNQLSNEEQLEGCARELFSWTPSVNEKRWQAADRSITDKFLGVIRIESKRPSIKIFD